MATKAQILKVEKRINKTIKDLFSEKIRDMKPVIFQYQNGIMKNEIGWQFRHINKKPRKGQLFKIHGNKYTVKILKVVKY